MRRQARDLPQLSAQDIQRFWNKVARTDDTSCWLWLGSKLPSGYGNFGKGRTKRYFAHRIAFQLAHGSFLETLQVCHSCDNPSCVRPDHLFLGTHKDNAADAKSKGRSARHEKHGMRKLSWAEVHEIRRLHQTGAYKLKTLASLYGVCFQLISLIVRKEIWKED